jgi:hypothetical protein
MELKVTITVFRTAVNRLRNEKLQWTTVLMEMLHTHKSTERTWGIERGARILYWGGRRTASSPEHVFICILLLQQEKE